MTRAVRLGDALEVLRTLPAESAHSLVTDPPAGIGLFGLEWDGDRGGGDAWTEWLASVLREAARALKPGAHGWVWAYPRTSHWTARACELAGLEVRDVGVHLFAYRMPKGIDVGQAIDRALGEHGTGALNVGACMVGDRLPSSVTLEHAPTCAADCDVRCPVGLLGENARAFYAHRPSRAELEAGCDTLARRAMDDRVDPDGRGNYHPSPKPIALMRRLVRLVTPPGGLVLDPFAGSGTTGAAAMLEGASFLGIERDAAMARVARARIDYWRRKAGR